MRVYYSCVCLTVHTCEPSTCLNNVWRTDRQKRMCEQDSKTQYIHKHIYPTHAPDSTRATILITLTHSVRIQSLFHALSETAQVRHYNLQPSVATAQTLNAHSSTEKFRRIRERKWKETIFTKCMDWRTHLSKYSGFRVSGPDCTLHSAITHVISVLE